MNGFVLFSARNPIQRHISKISKQFSLLMINRKPKNDILLSMYKIPHKYKFNYSAGDSIVYHQIQKTASTIFNLHLVNNLKLPCNCTASVILTLTCSCKNDLGIDWLYSRLSRQLCKVHASWHQFQKCLPQLKDKISKRLFKLGESFFVNF